MNILEHPLYKELGSIFSQILTDNNCLTYDNVIIKDLSILLPTRSSDQIIIVDCGDHQIDADVN